MNEHTDLALRGLLKRFGTSTAVRDVNLDIKKGEFISLLGPSGCGKSTTLMMIAGFEDPSEGEILIRGKRVDHLQVEQRNIGIVFQSYALFPHMTVWKNVEYGLKMRNVRAEERKQRVEKILRMVHMVDYASRLPRDLSGGQQQRVALARALVIEPDLLLLDEPFSALDRSLREDLQREVRALQKALNITTLFVTHDQDEALLMSDRIAVMKAGRIEQCATPAVLYNQPATHFVASFVGRGTFIQGKLLSSADDKRVFQTSLGEVSLPLNNVMREGLDADGKGLVTSDAALFVRPEHVLATSAAGNTGLHAEGTVAVVYFQGATSFADMVVPGLDEMMLVNVSHLNAQQALHEGMKVPLYIANESIRAYSHQKHA